MASHVEIVLRKTRGMTLLNKIGVTLRPSSFGLLTGLTLFLSPALPPAIFSMALAVPAHSVTKLNDDS